MAEKINVSLYGGKSIFGGKEDPLEADEIYCDRADKCSFYASGKCLRCRSFLAPSCKFGKVVTTKGYTSRAAKYYDFKKKYAKDPLYCKLEYPISTVAVMGETLYIRTGYVEVRRKTDNERDRWRKAINGYVVTDPGFGNCYVFIPITDVTNELLFEIFSFRPHAIMGGVIEDWENKKVPEILQDMKSVAPEIYDKFIDEYPQFKYEPNYIGKKAFICSLKQGASFTTKNGAEWLYDGEYIETEKMDLGLSSPWWLQGVEYGKVRIKVTPEMTVEINDNSIVDENTKFA